MFICQDRIFSLSKSNQIEVFFQSDMFHSSPNKCICITAVEYILLGCNRGNYFGPSDAILLNNQGLIKNRSKLKYRVDKIVASEHDTYIIISNRLIQLKRCRD